LEKDKKTERPFLEIIYFFEVITFTMSLKLLNNVKENYPARFAFLIKNNVLLQHSISSLKIIRTFFDKDKKGFLTSSTDVRIPPNVKIIPWMHRHPMPFNENHLPGG